MSTFSNVRRECLMICKWNAASNGVAGSSPVLGMVESQVGLAQMAEILESATELDERRVGWGLLEEHAFRVRVSLGRCAVEFVADGR